MTIVRIELRFIGQPEGSLRGRLERLVASAQSTRVVGGVVVRPANSNAPAGYPSKGPLNTRVHLVCPPPRRRMRTRSTTPVHTTTANTPDSPIAIAAHTTTTTSSTVHQPLSSSEPCARLEFLYAREADIASAEDLEPDPTSPPPTTPATTTPNATTATTSEEQWTSSAVDTESLYELELYHYVEELAAAATVPTNSTVELPVIANAETASDRDSTLVTIIGTTIRTTSISMAHTVSTPGHIRGLTTNVARTESITTPPPRTSTPTLIVPEASSSRGVQLPTSGQNGGNFEPQTSKKVEFTTASARQQSSSASVIRLTQPIVQEASGEVIASVTGQNTATWHVVSAGGRRGERSGGRLEQRWGGGESESAPMDDVGSDTPPADFQPSVSAANSAATVAFSVLVGRPFSFARFLLGAAHTKSVCFKAGSYFVREQYCKFAQLTCAYKYVGHSESNENR